MISVGESKGVVGIKSVRQLEARLCTQLDVHSVCTYKCLYLHAVCKHAIHEHV